MMKYILPVMLLCVVFWPGQDAYAQSELVVQWDTDGNGEPVLNALRDAVLADVDRPPDRVYKLLKGGYYWITDPIENDGFHLRIIGEEAGDSEFENPPVIQMVTREDGTAHSGSLLLADGSVTLRNLWITGADNNGTQTYYEPVNFRGTGNEILIDNVVFDRSNFAMIAVNGSNNYITVINSTFRNLVHNPGSQQWEGRAISIWADQKEVIVENNTFFNVGMTALQIESGAAEYVRFVHNTFVNVGRAINTGGWYREAYVANNLIINGFWHGEGTADFGVDRDVRSTFSGIFGVGDLPSIYGPNLGRRILFSNTAAWRDPAFDTYYAANNVVPQYFIGPVANEDYFGNPGLPNIVARDTTWLASRPNLGTYPAELVPLMIANISDLRAENLPPTSWFWNLPEFDGEICHVCVSWPLPEDFSYDDSSLMTASLNGLPLGNLNWFPAAKADWDANYDVYVSEIEASAGPVLQLSIAGTVQAEAGDLTGTAEVQDYDGELPFFRVEGGGFIRWEFELAAASTISLEVTTRSQDAVRGQHVRVNGNGIRNDEGYGEVYWSDLDPVEWKTYAYSTANLVAGTAEFLDLEAGPNQIEIAPSWGWQQFLSVEVFVDGSSVAFLDAGNVLEFEIATLESPEGGSAVPSGFKWVNLGSNGGISWTFDDVAEGEYALQVFYQNLGDASTGVISVGGNEVGTINFDATESDVDIDAILADFFALGSGTQTITLTGGNDVLIDFIQFIKKEATSIYDGTEIPSGFDLAQNYPNPFNPSTTIRFALPTAQDVSLTVYNILGQQVAMLANGFFSQGVHSLQFNASNLASGTYIYRLQTGSFVQTRKMLLIK